MGVTSLVFGILALLATVFGIVTGPFGPAAGLLFSILAIALGTPAAKLKSKAGKVGKGLGVFSLIWMLICLIIIVVGIITGGQLFVKIAELFRDSIPAISNALDKIAGFASKLGK